MPCVADTTHAQKGQEPRGPPKFLTFLSTHATLFVDPGRPSGTSPIRSLCVGFWLVKTIAICIILNNGAVSRLQGVRSPLWPRWCPVYASVISFGGFTASITATLGMGGWLDFTQQGLSPCKKRQACLAHERVRSTFFAVPPPSFVFGRFTTTTPTPLASLSPESQETRTTQPGLKRLQPR